MDRRLVGIDYGSRRVGVAVSDPTGILATPHSQIEYRGRADLVERLTDLVQNEGGAGVVIGDPRHMSGEPSAGSSEVSELAAALAARLGLPVWLWDERLSTVDAEVRLREADERGRKRTRGGRGSDPGRGRRQRLDRAAAALILQGFLDAHRDRNLPPGVPPAADQTAGEG
jgi:putative Holliday junction resolvase